jgi:S-adenosylmethionine hydrolase
MNQACISLMTDFGLQHTYVGQMKGVIAAINPGAVVIDLTHAIPPQQIIQGAMALADSVEAFPAGTIHVAVVDPGVGTARRAIAAEIGRNKFVCPDNGLLTLILQQEEVRRAVQLDNPRWHRPSVSATFHGRDLFAPVAAAWSLGHDLAELGSPITTPLVQLPWPDPQIETSPQGTTVRGQVLAIDHFGNLITNVPQTAVPAEALGVRIEFAGRCLTSIQRCYGDRAEGECLALFGSSGRLEIAIVNGNAAHELKAAVGEPITIRWSR